MIFNFRPQGRNCWDSAPRAVLRFHGHPELLAAEADGQARSPCDSCAIQWSTRIALDWFLFPTGFRKTISSEALPKPWSVALRALRSNRVLGISLADFSNFVCKVSTRQKLKCERVWVKLLLFAATWFHFHCHTLVEKICRTVFWRVTFSIGRQMCRYKKVPQLEKTSWLMQRRLGVRSQICGNCRGRSKSWPRQSAMMLRWFLPRSNPSLLLPNLHSCETWSFEININAPSSLCCWNIFLSVPWWFDQFTALWKHTTAFSGPLRPRFSPCAFSWTRSVPDCRNSLRLARRSWTVS